MCEVTMKPSPYIKPIVGFWDSPGTCVIMSLQHLCRRHGQWNLQAIVGIRSGQWVVSYITICTEII